jgi:hypothetical protein
MLLKKVHLYYGFIKIKETRGLSKIHLKADYMSSLINQSTKCCFICDRLPEQYILISDRPMKATGASAGAWGAFGSATCRMLASGDWRSAICLKVHT